MPYAVRMHAMILLAHGARDARWAQPFQAIREQLRGARPGIAVELAFLEFMEPTLAGACEQLVARGASRIVVCPLFLGVGGHVARDLPRLLRDVEQRWPSVSFECTPTLGDDPELLRAIAGACLRVIGTPAPACTEVVNVGSAFRVPHEVRQAVAVKIDDRGTRCGM